MDHTGPDDSQGGTVGKIYFCLVVSIVNSQYNLLRYLKQQNYKRMRYHLFFNSFVLILDFLADKRFSMSLGARFFYASFWYIGHKILCTVFVPSGDILQCFVQGVIYSPYFPIHCHSPTMGACPELALLCVKLGMYISMQHANAKQYNYNTRYQSG